LPLEQLWPGAAFGVDYFYFGCHISIDYSSWVAILLVLAGSCVFDSSAFILLMNKKKKVLVTGGAGYVGSVVVPALLERGYDVRVFDNLTFGAESLQQVRDKVELVKGDVRNFPPEVLDGVWGIIHLAGLSTEATSYYSPRTTDQINHIATEQIAKLAKARGIERFIFPSSCSVYFTYNTPLVPPFYTEDEQVNTISPYSISKRMAEEALAELTDVNFLPIIFRKATIYGFSPRMRYDLVVNSFTKDAFDKKRINVHAGGEIYRPMIDIQDVAAAYCAALELPLETVGGKIYNVVQSNWRIGDLAEKFRETMKARKGVDVAVDVQPVGAARNYQADGSRFQADFKLASVRPLEDAITELWSQLEQGHDFKNPKWYNDYWQINLMKSGKAELA